MRNQIFLIVFFMLLIPLSSALEEIDSDQIEVDMISAKTLINRMSDEGFFVQRLNDTYKAASQIYDAQSKLLESRRDYTLVRQYLDEIFSLESEAYVARDELDYVKQTYDFTKENNPNIDLSEADELYEEMIFEFESERYDRAYDLARDTYKKIIEIEGQYTALNLAYQATTKSIKGFIVNNWIVLSVVFVSAIFLYIIFRNRLIYFRIQLKIKRLEKESKVLEELIKQSQLDYFETGNLPESTYRIRIKKFSELIRDINRQLPLLREELMKRNRKDLDEAKKEVGKYKKPEEKKSKIQAVNKKPKVVKKVKKKSIRKKSKKVKKKSNKKTKKK